MTAVTPVVYGILIRWIAKAEADEHRARDGFVPPNCYGYSKAFGYGANTYYSGLSEKNEVGAIIVDQGPKNAPIFMRGRCIERIFVVEPEFTP